MTRTGLFLSALGVAASACQATHAEASRPVVVPERVAATTTTTTSHTVEPPPPQNVCVALDKSKYELPPLETHVGTVAALPPLPPLPPIVDDSHDLASF